MQTVILDVVVLEDAQSCGSVVDTVIGRIQGFQPKVVRLDSAELIIGPIGDLSDAIDALISGIGDQDRQQVHFVLTAFRVHAQHMLEVVNESGILIHHAQDIGNADRSHLLERGGSGNLNNTYK